MSGIKEKKDKKELMKVKKILHPNSRKANAIVKRNHKSMNKQKAKLVNMAKHQLIGEKLMWFQQNMHPNVCPYTREDLVVELLLKYIGRNDEELEQIEIKRSIGRRGRQHANREDIIMMTKSEEQRQFDTCGLEIPDIFNRVQCEMLRNWNGDLKLLPNFKFRRFGRKHLRNALEKTYRESRIEEFNKLQKTKENKDE